MRKYRHVPGRLVRPAAPLLLALLASAGLAGCSSCTPATDVRLTWTVETVDTRTLPLLDSGQGQVGAVHVPDSHGALRLRAGLAGADGVEATLTGFAAMFERTGPAPVRVQAVAAPQPWSRNATGAWHGPLSDGDAVTVWWSIDPGLVDDARAMLLPGGRNHTVEAAFAWQAEDCGAIVEGTSTASTGTAVAPARRATAFEEDGAAAVDRDGQQVSFTAPLRATGATTLQKAGALAVLYPQADPGAPSAVRFEDVAVHASGGDPDVEAGETVVVRSRQPAPLAPGGGGAGLLVLAVEVHHVPDGGLASEAELFGYAFLA